MLAHPWVVGGGLQREVECHLEAERIRLGNEGVELLDGAQLRVHGVMATFVAADRPR